MSAQAAKTVLLVDDDDDFIFQQRLCLEARGYRVLTATSGSQARKILTEQRADAAILDLMMEEMDTGFVLSHHIKKDFPGTPVILVTAVSGQTGIEFASDGRDTSWIKADTILTKPVRAEQLISEIEKLTA